MKTIGKNSEFVLEIKKSKFMAFCFEVQTEYEAQQIVKDYQKKYADATHVCYAYKLTNTAKMSDDGEPQGTAGKPIFDLITLKNLTNTLVIVVRYFGGIKLGAGGLTRAYSNSANEVIKIAGEKEIVETLIIMFELPINKSRLINQIEKIDGVLNSSVEYGNNITITLNVRKEIDCNIKQQINSIVQDIVFKE